MLHGKHQSARFLQELDSIVAVDGAHDGAAIDRRAFTADAEKDRPAVAVESVIDVVRLIPRAS